MDNTDALYSLYYRVISHEWKKSQTSLPSGYISTTPEMVDAMRQESWLDWWSSLDLLEKQASFADWRAREVMAAADRRSTAVDGGLGEWYHSAYCRRERYYDDSHQKDLALLADAHCQFLKSR